MSDRKILVHDFPHETTFPPKGYGGIERWLWTIANEACLAGDEVAIAGPLWDTSTLPDILHIKERISHATKRSILNQFGRADLIIAGHEFFGKPEWDEPCLEISDHTASYQHRPDLYDNIAYDGIRSHLFCFSGEMMKRFEMQKPTKLLHGSYCYEEEPMENDPEDYVIWFGRVDDEKALHYAHKIPDETGLPLKVMGPVKREYLDRYRGMLGKGSIEFIGEKFGREKMEIISRARCAIYTLDPRYIEAGVLVFAEGLRCGVPFSAMTWKEDDCAAEAIDKDSGKLISVDESMSIDSISKKMAEGVMAAIELDRTQVANYNQERFNAGKLTASMFNTSLNGKK